MSGDVKYVVLWGEDGEVEKTRAEIEAEFDRVFGGDSWHFEPPRRGIDDEYSAMAWRGDSLEVTLSDLTDEWEISDLSFGGWCTGSGNSIEDAYTDLVRSLRDLAAEAGRLADLREANGRLSLSSTGAEEGRLSVKEET